MTHIFLSYRKTDHDLCQAFKQRLEDEGYKVWWDDHLKPGRDYSRDLEDRLRSAAAIVTLWTRRSVQSKWVYFETLMASEMEKSVPLKLDDCELPEGLRTLQTYPYDPAWSRDSFEWKAILRRIDEAIEGGRASTQHVAPLDTVTWGQIRDSKDAEDFEDFLERYPDSPHIEAARSALAARRRKTRVRSLIWWSLGLLTYAALIAPMAALLLEYPSDKAWFLASLYFNFFMFFPIFGTMMVPIYFFTLAKALRFGLSRRQGRSGALRSRVIAILALVVAPIVSCALIAHLEVGDGYAPWQFTDTVLDTPVKQLATEVPGIERQDDRPSALDETRSLGQIFDTIRGFTLTSAWSARSAELSDLPCAALPARTPDAALSSDPNCLVHMNELQQVMEHHLRDPQALSLTGRAYAFGFFFFALAFIGTYFNIFFLTFRSEEVRVWMARLSPWSGQRYGQILQLFAIQLAFISIWFVARMIFQLETQTIIPNSGGEQFTQAIRNHYFAFLAIYFVAIGFVLAAALRLNGAMTRLGIVLIAGITTAFMALAFSATWFCRALQMVIGVHATNASFLILAIVTIFILFVPLVLPNLFPKREDDLLR